ncbi:MAG: hypothetical protein HYV90_03710 [Candidatus Woesebacteria bacterium]|nr:MAG: hypothetical protein HYV90_03710 [Candidatus Woesebacteria bacterium]
MTKLSDLSPEAKNAIMATAILMLWVIAPIFWGIVLLAIFQVTDAPWALIAVIATILLTLASWLILWGRIKSDVFVGTDVIVSIALILCLIGTLSSSHEVTLVWSTLIYMVCLMQIAIHVCAALIAALGFEITTKSVPAETQSS